MFDLNNRYLYHYTTFESAVKIIASRRLLFSSFNGLNDINESCGPDVFSLDEESNDCIQRIISEYSQISFTIDKKRKGFDIPAMWGHYASKGKGVCLYFEIIQLQQDVANNGLYADEVTYRNDYDPNEHCFQKDIHYSIKEFFEKEKDTLFFRKSLDWEYEQEYRVIPINGNPEALSVEKSLKGVILFNRRHQDFMNSVEYLTLSKLDQSLDIYRYFPSFGRGNLYNITGNRITPTPHFDLHNITVSED